MKLTRKRTLWSLALTVALSVVTGVLAWARKANPRRNDHG